MVTTSTLKDTAEEGLREQFEAVQLDGDIDSARAARAILKQIQLSVLNSDNHNDEDADNNDDDDDKEEREETIPSSTEERISHILQPLLLKYVDVALATTTATTVETREVLERVLNLVAALACTLDGTMVSSILDRIQLFSVTSTDKARSQACTLLGLVASNLHRQAVLLENIRKRKSKERDVEDRTESWPIKYLERIEDVLVPRLKDTHQTVRQSAIQAVGILLQDDSARHRRRHNTQVVTNETEVSTTVTMPTTGFPTALEELLWSMWHDPSVANRVEALHAAPIVSLVEVNDGNGDEEEEDDDDEDYSRSTIDQ